MRFLLFLLLLVPVLLPAQDSALIRSRKFYFGIKDSRDWANEERRKTLFVSRVTNGQKKQLLSHTIYAEDNGGCGDRHDEERGTYRVTDSSMIFYSYWAHAGLAIGGVCGVRRQEYLVDTNGRVRPGERLIHLELAGGAPEIDSLMKWEAEVEYDSLTWEKTKKQLARKMDRLVGKNYGAVFVYGKTAQALRKDVVRVLSKEIEECHAELDRHDKHHSGKRSGCRGTEIPGK